MSDLNLNYQNNDEQIIKYLEGKLSGEELHGFENQMSDSSMLDDAVEGLNTIDNKQKIDNYVNDLNKHLHNYISLKKKRRLKHKLELNDWTLVSIFLIITLCIIAYCVIKQFIN